MVAVPVLLSAGLWVSDVGSSCGNTGMPVVVLKGGHGILGCKGVGTRCDMSDHVVYSKVGKPITVVCTIEHHARSFVNVFVDRGRSHCLDFPIGISR